MFQLSLATRYVTLTFWDFDPLCMVLQVDFPFFYLKVRGGQPEFVFCILWQLKENNPLKISWQS